MKELIKKLSTLTDCLAFYIEDCMARGQSNATITSKNNLMLMFICWAATKQITKISNVDLFVMEEYRRYYQLIENLKIKSHFQLLHKLSV